MSSSLISRGLNTIANVLRTPEEQARRDKQIEYWTMVKMANLVGLIAAAIFVILIPHIITFVLAGLVALIAVDTMSLASNMLEMTKDITVSATARISKENLIAQMTKNTLFSEMVINLINPTFEEMIRDIDRIGR